MNYLRSILLSFLALFLIGETHAQELELISEFESPSASSIYSDHLGNIYLIDYSTIIKLNSSGEKLYEYNNPGLGMITYINVFNPLNLLVFYEESNQYVFLDNRLNPNLNSFTPANSGYFDVQLAATKDQNNIWFYDQVNDKIHLWSLSKNSVISSSLQVRQLVNNKERPNYIYATIKRVYLNIPDVGIVVFDNLGSYEKTIPITGLNKFFLSDNSLIFLKDQKLEVFNYFTKQSKFIEIDENFEDLSFSSDQLFILKNKLIKNYKIVIN